MLGSIRYKSRGGHNPDPVKDQGKCCSRCNYEVVIPEVPVAEKKKRDDEEEAGRSLYE